MDDKQREIEHLRMMSRQSVESDKFRKAKSNKKTEPFFSRNGKELDTSAVFLMLRICICLVAIVVVIANDLFIGNETVAVFNQSSDYISHSLTIQEIVQWLQSLSLERLLSYFS